MEFGPILGHHRLLRHDGAMSAPKTKAEWLAELQAARAQASSVSPGIGPPVAYGSGIKNVAIRLWPPAIVYRQPPKSLHGTY